MTLDPSDLPLIRFYLGCGLGHLEVARRLGITPLALSRLLRGQG